MRRSSAHDLPTAIGRYEVVRLLGTGAMGRVALARDPVLDRQVALKLLRTDIAIPDDLRDGLLIRMRHEAKAAARVSHPNLVVLHDMGEDEHAGLYLVFEYVEGPTLKQRLEKGPLKTVDVARLARELGQALRFAHDAGVLHRDVKPDNVILSITGAKLVDFGIARVPDSTLTHQGGLLGTPAYSAPETFRAGTFSPQSDQFSLAATIYEAVFGTRAFPGDDAVAVASHIAHEPPERRAARASLPEAVDEVLARGMARAPEDRFPSCEAFGRALEQPLTGGVVPRRDPAAPGGSGPSSRAPHSVPPPARKPHQVVLGGLAVLVVAGLVVRAATREPEVTVESTASAAPLPSPVASVEPPRSENARRPRLPARGTTAEPRPSSSVPASGSASPAVSASAPPPASALPSAPAAADAGPPPRDAGADAGPGALVNPRRGL